MTRLFFVFFEVLAIRGFLNKPIAYTPDAATLLSVAENNRPDLYHFHPGTEKGGRMPYPGCIEFS